jgi:hypothetical protein
MGEHVYVVTSKTGELEGVYKHVGNINRDFDVDEVDITRVLLAD